MKKDQKDKFFDDLALESGISDISAIKQIYYSFVRMTVRNTMQLTKYRLPDLGEFRLKTIPERRQHIASLKDFRVVPAVHFLDFASDFKVKDRINNRDSQTKAQAK